MKKLLILFILFSTVILSCNKDPEPEPEVIRAYCYLYHFIPELESVVWDVDDSEVPYDPFFGEQFAGSIILESTTEEIVFTVKHADTKDVLISQFLQLEQDKYYNVIVHGPTEAPVLLFREIDTSRPQSGQVKFQVLHSSPGQNDIDVYMGGTTADKRDVSELAYLSLTTPFEVLETDARAAIVVSAHSEEYNQDSVLVSMIYNGDIVSGASYLSVFAPDTHESLSELDLWIYSVVTD